MKIGILSDTHNDSAATQQALAIFRQHGVRTLFHCGDLATAAMVTYFNGFEVFFVRGNMDRHLAPAIKAMMADQPGVHWLGRGDLVELDSKVIAIAHGDREGVLETLLYAEPDYLFTGHSHQRRDHRIGRTRIINPGALGGTQHEARSVCILELATDQLEIVYL